MKKILCNDSEILELVSNNGVTITCNDRLELEISDEDVVLIQKIINGFARVIDYGSYVFLYIIK